ncbi:MAG: hypothetical protein HY749_24355 [Gammaproteobacteria bacterium]|nr:hypothetical protein [Gammaproteobacteria bacterium]
MIDSYCEVPRFRFAGLVRHWARERLVHDVLVARELARGVLDEGLRFQSVDPQWTPAATPLRGEPLVGYAAHRTLPPIMIRETALDHLRAIAAAKRDPDYRLLHEECVTKDDFRKWLVATGRALPAFWFEASERQLETPELMVPYANGR